MINEIIRFLIKTNRLLFLLIHTFFGVILNIVLSLISYDLLGVNLGQENDVLLSLSKNIQFILAVFIAPLIETTLFQYLPIVLALNILLEINVISTLSTKHYAIVIIVSSILFASIHIFSITYFLTALIMGLFFGYITVISEFVREKKINVFISVGITHALINLIAILLD